ncbi:hypothetical protein [Streptomyces sp. NPDC006012]|uniref:hypothetical protein n=1 Tax=Streptomyces sp. NPDC006012 TaxID=3364739 RepID=UPI0036BC1D3D
MGTYLVRRVQVRLAPSSLRATWRSKSPPFQRTSWVRPSGRVRLSPLSATTLQPAGGGTAAFKVTPKAFSDFVEAAARGSL